MTIRFIVFITKSKTLKLSPVSLNEKPRNHISRYHTSPPTTDPRNHSTPPHLSTLRKSSCPTSQLTRTKSQAEFNPKSPPLRSLILLFFRIGTTLSRCSVLVVVHVRTHRRDLPPLLPPPTTTAAAAAAQRQSQPGAARCSFAQGVAQPGGGESARGWMGACII